MAPSFCGGARLGPVTACCSEPWSACPARSVSAHSQLLSPRALQDRGVGIGPGIAYSKSGEPYEGFLLACRFCAPEHNSACYISNARLQKMEEQNAVSTSSVALGIPHLFCAQRVVCLQCLSVYLAPNPPHLPFGALSLLSQPGSWDPRAGRQAHADPAEHGVVVRRAVCLLGL